MTEALVESYSTNSNVYMAYPAGDLPSDLGVVIAFKETTTESLTAEQVTGFLQTYYGTTNIFNSENANMEVEYLADTKLYIDNKLAELSSAILNK